MEEKLNYDGVDINGLYYKKEKPYNNQKHIIGIKKDLLTAISPVTILNDKICTKKGWWLFKCDCGNLICRLLSSTRYPKTIQSCGCYQKQQYDNKFIGKKFNRLTVIERDNSYKTINNINSPYVYYKCKCDCGNYTTVRVNTLVAGEVKSCGCLKKEQEGKNLIHGYNFIDLTGRKYGLLTVIKKDENKYKDGELRWLCKCECGNTKLIRGISLRNGDTCSCGCLKMSSGEFKIYTLLKENNIDFLYNSNYFKDLKSIKDSLCRYDFIIFENNLPIRIIEFDGEQHYKPIEAIGGEQNYNIRKENDRIKNEYAINHKIPLIRIPYFEKNNITLELLFSDKFLIKEGMF